MRLLSLVCQPPLNTNRRKSKSSRSFTSEVQQKSQSRGKVAGMLVYYILSSGKHPFDVKNSKDIETNIREGTYSLDGVGDIEARDLIERMINIDPAQRPTIEDALDKHPYFYDDDRKDAVLRKLGDREEVQFYGTLKRIYKETSKQGNPGGALTLDKAIQSVVDDNPNNNPKRKEEVKNAIHNTVGEDLAKLQNLCDTANKYSAGKSFSAWKTDLLQIWTLPKDIDTNTSEDVIGLFRFMRNKLVHEKARFDEKKMLNHYPDFFISL